MIVLTIPDTEYYDERTKTFYPTPGGTFRFEHCLKAIMKWEGIYKTPFLELREDELTYDQLMTYYICMELDGRLQSYHLTDEVISVLQRRMADKPTATKITTKENQTGTKASYTSAELIYAMMAQAGVPFTSEEWNINNLLMTLRIISLQSSEQQPMSREEILRQNADLNAKRRAQMNSRG